MTRDSENREWLNDYMSLKQVNENNPFAVPEGYFDDLGEHVISQIKLDELKNETAAQGFVVPENYFDELTGNIQARINIEENLNKENTGFTIPGDYFENLQQQIQSRILVEDALSETAESFTVPQEYFSQLTENILNKTTKQSPEKRKGVVRHLFSSVAFKYATVACFILVIGGTIFLSRNSNTVAQDHTSSFLHKSIAALPIGDIQSYLQLNVDASDTRTLIDESKQVNAENLSNDLQDELDTTSQ
ncbi:MAG: hypothetical protein ABI203_11370 [Mucilaginibacter sp.]